MAAASDDNTNIHYSIISFSQTITFLALTFTRLYLKRPAAVSNDEIVPPSPVRSNNLEKMDGESDENEMSGQPPSKKVKVENDDLRVGEGSNLLVDEVQQQAAHHQNNLGNVNNGTSNNKTRTHQKCSVCSVILQENNSTPTQRMKGSSAKCNACKITAIAKANSMQALKEHKCAECKNVKRNEHFDKGQQKKGNKSKCKKCVAKIQAEADARKAKASAKKQKSSKVVDETQNKAAKGTKRKAGTMSKTKEQMKSDNTANQHPQRIKKKVMTNETELDDGTKIVETETVETHPDGTVVRMTESILEKTTNLPNGFLLVERTTTKTETKTEHITVPGARDGRSKV